MNISCSNNTNVTTVLCTNRTSLNWFAVIVQTLTIVQDIILFVLISRLKSISQVCRFTWLNDILANIGIFTCLLLYQFVQGLSVFNLDYNDRLVLLITSRKFVMVCMYMYGANMYYIYSAFRSGFANTSPNHFKLYSIIGAVWIWNVLISCLVLFDPSLLRFENNFASYVFTEYGIWIITIQLINTFIIPQSVFFYSAFRIHQYQKKRKMTKTATHFVRGVRLAKLMLRFNIIQMISLTPIIVMSYFSYEIEKRGMTHPTVEFCLITISTVCDFLKLPVYLMRNKELRTVFVDFRKRYCCVRVAPNEDITQRNNDQRTSDKSVSFINIAKRDQTETVQQFNSEKSKSNSTCRI